MGYTVLKNFERGIDARRLLDCTEVGALVDARDCHITRGGEIEKRAAFVVVGTLPATTMGFFATDGPHFHTWGEVSTPAGLPASAIYHQITDFDPSVPGYVPKPLVAIMSVDLFLGKLYVVAQYEGGKFIHWWDDDPVTTYIPPPSEVTSDDPEDPIIVPPPPTGTGGAKPEATVTWAFGGSSSGTPKLTGLWLIPPTFTTYSAWISIVPYISIDSNGLQRCSVTIPRGDGTGSSIAATITNLINTYLNSPVDITSAITGAQMRFTAEDTTATYNGWAIAFAGNYINWNLHDFAYFTGGTNPIAPPGLRGTFDPGLRSIGDPGVALAIGSFAITHNRRVFSMDNTILRFSMEDSPKRWDTLNPTAGFIDHSTITNGQPILMGACDYQDGLAVFAQRHVFIWETDPDPKQFKKHQILHNTGTLSPHSITPYSESEAMYLDRSGIRSLRSRTSVDVSYSGDLGSLIDSLVVAKIKTMSVDEQYHKVWGTVEPRSGRLWMALDNVIYVLSYFPDTHIAGWTWYDASEHPVTMMNANYTGIFWRSGNDIIAYGGLTFDQYDDAEAVVRVPYVDAGKPATRKAWTGIDLAIYGTWQIKAGFDATQPTTLDLIANLSKSTYAQQKIAVNGDAPSMSLEMRSSFVGPARIGNAATHYNDEDAD